MLEDAAADGGARPGDLCHFCSNCIRDGLSRRKSRSLGSSAATTAEPRARRSFLLLATRPRTRRKSASHLLPYRCSEIARPEGARTRNGVMQVPGSYGVHAARRPVDEG